MRISQPVAIEALANCSSRTSRWDRIHRGLGRLAAPVQDEHALLADLRQARREAGHPLRGLLVGDEAPGVVEQAGVHELGDRVDEARAAHADRFGVADHLERQPSPSIAHALDRAVGGAHPAPDLGGLERRAGRRRAREHALAGAQRDLAVGADVDEQPQATVARESGGQHPGDDVAADVGAEGGKHEGRRARMHRDAEVGG